MDQVQTSDRKAPIKTEHEHTVPEIIKLFEVSKYMVYYWVEKKYVQARKLPTGILIKLPPLKAEELQLRINNSYKRNKNPF